MNGDTNPTMSELELEISETRESLEHNLNEIGRRLQPKALTSELKEAVNRLGRKKSEQGQAWP